MPESNKKEQPKVAWFWINNTDGKPSMSATFATVAFGVTTLMYAVSLFEKLGTFSIRAFDPAVCSAYMIPVLSLYFGRRWTDAKTASSQQPAGDDQ